MEFISPFELAIRNRAAQITAYRFQLQNDRSERRKLMAIEIKSLKAKALAARANLDDLNKAYDRFNELAPAHAADIARMASDIGSMQEDLAFATDLMGNSVGESDRLAVEHKPPVVAPNIAAGMGDLNLPMAAPEPAVAREITPLFFPPLDGPPRVISEVAEAASQTFRAAE